MKHCYKLLEFTTAMPMPTLLVLLISLLLTSNSKSAQADDAELLTLLTIKKDWGKPAALRSWKNSSSNTTASASFTHYCKWAGVACSNGQVTALSLQNFNIAHPIPASICRLKNLTYIDLSYNNLTGEFPAAALYGCSALRFLDLSNNIFSGVLPADMNKLSPGMEHLNLSSNGFSGSLQLVGGFSWLKSLVLDTNSFNGSYLAISNLTQLETLTLASNPFAPGPIPDEFGNLFNLKMLWMSGMSLTGRIPDILSSLTELSTLALSANNLHGEIPAWVWKLQKLELLYLFTNSFSGAIGPDITAVGIQEIDLSDNYLTGPIPESIGNLKNLTLLYLYSNNISGAIPWSVGRLPNLTHLSLAGNQISGSIPVSISALGALNYLNLSGNDITGAIPAAAIGLLPALTVLDLSNNELEGHIPEDFNNLHLSYLNLSSNHLVGEVPDALQSPTYNAAFFGNPGLCARQDSGVALPTCPHPQEGGHSSAARMISNFTATISGISFVSFVCVSGWFAFRRRHVTSWKMIPFGTLNFTEQDIIGNMSEDNVIGRGGSGKVYRINLSGSHKARGHGGGGDGGAGHSTSTVAVKKIGRDGKPDANNDKEFEAEARSLGGLLHGNIVRLLCCISGDDTKLLVYEYMENGSLDRWLHRRGKRAAALGPLDWPTRLRIAVDVARGLSYMHHGFTSPIIHRDIKCSNILLDRGFRAKIADFGLARILTKSGESEPVSRCLRNVRLYCPWAKVNEKVDVYSFGVVLLELATGRGPQDGGTESGSCLAKWASKRFKNGGPCVGLVDGEIQDPAYLDDMVAVFELGVICTDEDPTLRPPMSEALHRLVQCGRNQMSIDDDTAKDVCGVDSVDSTV